MMELHFATNALQGSLILIPKAIQIAIASLAHQAHGLIQEQISVKIAHQAQQILILEALL